MTNAEKQLLIRICKSSISKKAAQNKVDFHFLAISKSTLSKYWRIFGAKDWNLKKQENNKKPRMTCKQYCPVWNDIDKDCEIYGEHHFTPRTCPHYNKELKQDD